MRRFISLLTLMACAAADPPSPDRSPDRSPPPGASPSAPGRSRSSDWDIRPLSTADLADQWTRATGSPRLVHFWASWCGPCVHELPIWRSFAGRHPTADIRMIDVDPLALQQPKVVPLIKNQGLSGIPQLLLQADAPDQALARVPGWANEIPHTVLIDGAGAVRETWPRPMTAEELERALASVTD